MCFAAFFIIIPKPMERGNKPRVPDKKKRKREEATRPKEYTLTSFDKMMIRHLMEDELGCIDDPVDRKNRIVYMWRQLERGLKNGVSPSRIFKLKRNWVNYSQPDVSTAINIDEMLTPDTDVPPSTSVDPKVVISEQKTVE